MRKCVVIGCPSATEKNCKLGSYGIPSIIRRQCKKTLKYTTLRRQVWLSIVEEFGDTSKLVPTFCSRHFASGKPAKLFDINNVDWAPSLGLILENVQSESVSSQKKEKKDSLKKKKGESKRKLGGVGEASTSNCDQGDLESDKPFSEDQEDMSKKKCSLKRKKGVEKSSPSNCDLEGLENDRPPPQIQVDMLVKLSKGIIKIEPKDSEINPLQSTFNNCHQEVYEYNETFPEDQEEIFVKEDIKIEPEEYSEMISKDFNSCFKEDNKTNEAYLPQQVTIGQVGLLENPLEYSEMSMDSTFNFSDQEHCETPEQEDMLFKGETGEKGEEFSELMPFNTCNESDVSEINNPKKQENFEETLEIDGKVVNMKDTKSNPYQTMCEEIKTLIKLQKKYKVAILPNTSSISSNKEDLTFQKLYEKSRTENIQLRHQCARLKLEMHKEVDRKFQAANIENNKLKSYYEKFSLSQEILEKDNSKLRFYTGFRSFSKFMKVFEFVSKGLSRSLSNKVPLFSEFLIVLMKLRFCFLEEDLGYRFGIEKSRVSFILYQWIRLMAFRLRDSISWTKNDVTNLIKYFEEPLVYEKKMNEAEQIAIKNNLNVTGTFSQGFQVKIVQLKKKFKILNVTVPSHWKLPKNQDEFSLIEMIVKICCSLVNICSLEE